MARTALDAAITAGDRTAIATEARATIAKLTDGRALTPLDMLQLGHARRTLAQVEAEMATKRFTATETISHNVRAYNRAMDKVTAAQTDGCPKCGGAVSPELLTIWGHCFTCQKASQAATYGF